MLKECRSEIAQSLEIDPNNIELSMGMSHDFEKAVIICFFDDFKN